MFNDDGKIFNDFRFGSQKHVIKSNQPQSINSLRTKCKHLLDLERQKFTITFKTSNKLYTKILPKDEGTLMIDDQYNIKLEDMN